MSPAPGVLLASILPYEARRGGETADGLRVDILSEDSARITGKVRNIDVRDLDHGDRIVGPPWSATLALTVSASTLKDGRSVWAVGAHVRDSNWLHPHVGNGGDVCLGSNRERLALDAKAGVDLAELWSRAVAVMGAYRRGAAYRGVLPRGQGDPPIDEDDDADDDIVSCVACGDDVDPDAACHVDGETFCPDCYHERYTVCDWCDEEVHRDHTCTVGDESWCESCYDYHATVCPVCGEARNGTADMTDVQEDGEVVWYCDGCVPSDVHECAHCGDHFHERDMTLDDEDEWFCGDDECLSHASMDKEDEEEDGDES